MNISELIASPLFPVSEYWGAYLFILFLTGFLKTDEESTPKLHAEHLASVALNICGYVTARSLSMNLNGQNNIAIEMLARRIDHSLVMANRIRKQSDMEFI
ncbi:hypothetical protein CGK40_17855 [Vibrio parahaemolyticus]|uniref:hypothetical protein n=1 Tax=Vibrio parahaemolyticus TaxID=670 RepID=UPI00111E67BD|nr:hypothetical protein [Vibrio parahaemolyticus]TNZ92715.1 hypothetical protein CGK40_17855 [Vibrio parahaemolyticus]